MTHYVTLFDKLAMEWPRQNIAAMMQQAHETGIGAILDRHENSMKQIMDAGMAASRVANAWTFEPSILHGTAVIENFTKQLIPNPIWPAPESYWPTADIIKATALPSEALKTFLSPKSILDQIAYHDLRGLLFPFERPDVDDGEEESNSEQEPENTSHLIELPAQLSQLVLALLQSKHHFFQMHPRKLEELVASIYEIIFGCTVELTMETRDGGYDIFAFEPLSRRTTLIECKRYAERRPVGVSLVRELRGTLDHWALRRNLDPANSGIAGALVTTSRFTPDAREAAAQFGVMAPLDLHEFAWLQRHVRRLADKLGIRSF